MRPGQARQIVPSSRFIRHPAISYSLVADDGVRHIRLFQVCDLFGGQHDGQGADGIFQMRDLRGPDDRRCYRPLLQQPDERDMHARNAVLLSQFCDALREVVGGGQWNVRRA